MPYVKSEHASPKTPSVKREQISPTTPLIKSEPISPSTLFIPPYQGWRKEDKPTTPRTPALQSPSRPFEAKTDRPIRLILKLSTPRPPPAKTSQHRYPTRLQYRTPLPQTQRECFIHVNNKVRRRQNKAFIKLGITPVPGHKGIPNGVELSREEKADVEWECGRFIWEEPYKKSKGEAKLWTLLRERGMKAERERLGMRRLGGGGALPEVWGREIRAEGYARIG